MPLKSGAATGPVVQPSAASFLLYVPEKYRQAAKLFPLLYECRAGYYLVRNELIWSEMT